MNSEAKKWVKSKLGRIHNLQDPCAHSYMHMLLILHLTQTLIVICNKGTNVDAQN